MTTYYNYLGQAMPVSDGSGPWINGDPNGGVTITAPPGPVSISVNGGNWDTLIAGQGDDTFYVNNVTDVVQAASGLSGIKTIVSYSGGYTLPANVQNLTFYGAGNWGAGNAGNNLIIMGGNDANVMDGGAGNDTFRFLSTAAADGDTILLFEPGDRIDLSGIDADIGTTGNQAFTLVTGASLTGAGQLAISFESRADGDFTIVQGNVDGNAGADFTIEIAGHQDLNNSNVTA